MVSKLNKLCSVLLFMKGELSPATNCYYTTIYCCQLQSSKLKKVPDTSYCFSAPMLPAAN